MMKLQWQMGNDLKEKIDSVIELRLNTYINKSL